MWYSPQRRASQTLREKVGLNHQERQRFWLVFGSDVRHEILLRDACSLYVQVYVCQAVIYRCLPMVMVYRNIFTGTSRKVDENLDFVVRVKPGVLCWNILD